MDDDDFEQVRLVSSHSTSSMSLTPSGLDGDWPSRPLTFHPRGQAGVFWRPESRETTVAGTYFVTEDGGVEVDLHGTLAPDGERKVAVLHGHVEGMPVTLLDCGLLGERTQSRGGPSPVTYSQWWVRSAVEMAHTDHEVAFNEIDIQLAHLSQWADVDAEFDHISWRDTAPAARVPGAEISINTQVSMIVQSYRSRTFRQEQVLSIRTDRPWAHDELWTTYVRPLVALLTLAIGQPLRPDVVHTGNTTRSAQNPRGFVDVEVRHHRPARDDYETDPTMLWTMSDLDFATSVRRWFDLDRRAALSLTLHQQARDGTGASPATSLLNAAIAAESLHRELYDPGGRPNLRTSLTSLVDGAGEIATQVLGHPESWITKVTKARNDLAHGNAAGMVLLREPARLQAMADSVTALVTLRLMSELGFTQDDIKRLTEWPRQAWADAARTACA